MTTRMKDIAAALGVSIVTVSKALRNHPDIAKETRLKILRKVEELHYRPNLLARSLVTGRSSLIGMIVPDLVHPFFAEIARSLSAALRSRGLFLIVSSSEGDPALECAEIEQMLAHRMDALIVASSQTDPTLLEHVKSSGPPLILIDRTVPGLTAHFIGSDDRRIGEIATDHLIDCGKRRIAHIRGPENNVGEQRLQGYRETLRRRRIPWSENYVVMPGGAIDTDGLTRGSNAMLQLMELPNPPDAVFCFNDLIAVGAMLSTLGAGLRVPDDIAFVGCGHYYYSRILPVPLTSVDQKVEEFGRKLAKVVVSLVGSEGPQKVRRVMLEPSLVIRSSSVPTLAENRPNKAVLFDRNIWKRDLADLGT
jgi:LacI family transcriptional regulator